MKEAFKGKVYTSYFAQNGHAVPSLSKGPARSHTDDLESLRASQKRRDEAREKAARRAREIKASFERHHKALKEAARRAEERRTNWP